MTSKTSGFVVWFTGLPASGKTTLAFLLEKHLRQEGRKVQVLDGDALRAVTSRDLGFSMEDRGEHVRRVAARAAHAATEGAVVLCALISPLREHRAEARRIVGSGQFHEVYLSASVAACEARDPKGNYRRARRGEIQHFTGISDIYEPPEHPALIIDTARCTPEESLRALANYLSDKEPTS